MNDSWLLSTWHFLGGPSRVSPSFVWFFLAWNIILIILVSAIAKRVARKSGFTNRSSMGFYYDTETLEFLSDDDRKLAHMALDARLTKDGYSYSAAQIATLSDQIVLDILETDDEAHIPVVEAKLTILLDPAYRGALASVLAARRNNNTFANAGERRAVFDLLSNYFSKINTPIGAPLSNWSDYVLIRTFQTLQLPQRSEVSSPAQSAGIPTVTPTIPDMVSAD